MVISVSSYHGNTGCAGYNEDDIITSHCGKELLHVLHDLEFTNIWQHLATLILHVPRVCMLPKSSHALTTFNCIVVSQAIFTRTGCSNCERKEVVLKEVAEAYQLNGKDSVMLWTTALVFKNRQ